MTDDTASAAALWDARYAESEQIWSGDPNTVLAREVAPLKPGTALDLGCGEGGDAIWLAERGWRVTAVDVSRVALDRAVKHAAAAGVGDRIDWQWHDLATSFPTGSFDLVSAQFLHSMGELPREEILRRASAAVAPGGVLLIEGHSGLPHWEQHDHPEMRLPTADEVVEALNLPDGKWEVLLKEEHERVQAMPDGESFIRTDSTVKLRRLSER